MNLSCNFGPVLSVGTIRFEDRFCASNKSGMGGGGGVSAQGAMYMAAALAGCRKPWLALVWAFLSFLIQTGVDKAPLPFKGLHFWHCRQLSVAWEKNSWSEGHCKLANE